MFKRLSHWTLTLSSSPRAPRALAAIDFAEASCFPLSPDVVLLPMSHAFALTGLVNRFGDRIKAALERHFAVVMGRNRALVVLGFWRALHMS